MALKVGEIYAEMTLDSSNFNKGLLKAKGNLAGTTGQINTATTATGKLGTNAAAASADVGKLGAAGAALSNPYTAAAAAVGLLVVGLLALKTAGLAAAMQFEKSQALFNKTNPDDTALGKIAIIGQKIRGIFIDIGQDALPGLKLGLDAITRLIDKWPQVWALIRMNLAYLQPIVGEIKQAFAPLAADFKQFFASGNAAKFIVGAFRGMADAIKQILPILKAVIALITFLVRAVMAVSSAIQSMLMWITRGKTGFAGLQAQIDMATEATMLLASQRAAAQERMTQAAKEAEAELQRQAGAVLDVVDAQRKSRVEAEKAKMASVGFMGVGDLYKRAQVAGQRAGARPGDLNPMSEKSLPGTEELKKIHADNLRQEKQAADLLKLTRERLGVYA